MADHSLVASLYQKHFGELFRFLSKRVGCRDLAADLLQELFLRLLASDDTATNIRHQRGFLFRCAHNLAAEAARTPRWRSATHTAETGDAWPVEEAQSPERQFDDKQTVDRLLDAVGNLPPRCREVFILHKFDGLSYPEVARQLGISMSMVEKHMMRALADCRTAVVTPSPGIPRRPEAA